MTIIEKIVKYLKDRKTGATGPEVATYAKVNYNTARKLLGRLKATTERRKCRVSGKMLQTYAA